VTVGPKKLAAGTVELTRRATKQVEDLELESAAAAIADSVRSALAAQ
jgi:hypothetical protein